MPLWCDAQHRQAPHAMRASPRQPLHAQFAPTLRHETRAHTRATTPTARQRRQRPLTLAPALRSRRAQMEENDDEGEDLFDGGFQKDYVADPILDTLERNSEDEIDYAPANFDERQRCAEPACAFAYALHSRGPRACDAAPRSQC